MRAVTDLFMGALMAAVIAIGSVMGMDVANE